jgi:hypothetical protein
MIGFPAEAAGLILREHPLRQRQEVNRLTTIQAAGQERLRVLMRDRHWRHPDEHFCLHSQKVDLRAYRQM